MVLSVLAVYIIVSSLAVACTRVVAVYITIIIVGLLTVAVVANE